VSNFQKNELPQNRAKKNWKAEKRHKNKSVSFLDYIEAKAPLIKNIVWGIDKSLMFKKNQSKAFRYVY